MFLGKRIINNIERNSKCRSLLNLKYFFCSSTTIFDKIIQKEIPSQIVYEDDKCLAFKDVSPQAPVHILLIPKVKDGLSQLQNAEERHKDILGHLMVKVAEIAKQNNLQQGYRVVINDGKLGCGTQMGWPPGVLGKQETIKSNI